MDHQPPRRNDSEPAPRERERSSSDSQPLPEMFKGSFKLGRVLWTDVYVHWSWFVVAYYIITGRQNIYSSMAWNVAEYVAGFAIVTLHEFGHVLACRSVGGRADRVLLWPMGGLAFVAHPPRPGASLWTTVAGPLVNVILAPILIVLAVATHPGEAEAPTDAALLIDALATFNLIVLIFNLLPIYPLDGGRILQAFLWFALGQAKSLAIAAFIGMAAGIAGVAFALMYQQWWLAAMAVFLTLGAYGGLAHARRLAAVEAIPRRRDLTCPKCGEHPPIGPYWPCLKCNLGCDRFAPDPCPAGRDHEAPPVCVACGEPSSAEEWATPDSH